MKPEAELLFKCLSASIITPGGEYTQMNVYMEECTHGKRVNTEGRTYGEAYTIRSVQVHMEENTHKGKLQIRKKDVHRGRKEGGIHGGEVQGK